MEKYAHIFDTRRLNTDLKKRSLKSGAVTLGSQALMFIIQLGSTMILARILSPDDYGINAMAMTITGFAGMFSSFGLSTATVQRPDITHEQVSTLFWINVLIGFLITLAIAAISPAAAWFYKAPELLWVMLTLSLIFTITGLGVQHHALLTRQMRFFSIVSINVISTLAGVVVAIIAGYFGFGYWALVFNLLTFVSLNTIGYWCFCKWIPGLPRRHSGVGAMIRFGSSLVVSNVVNYFPRYLDNVLIGRSHGSDALGLYSKAYQLLMMPITNFRDPLTRVAIPSLSRLQDNPEQYRDYFLKCVSLLAFISMPLVTFMFVFSDQLISLLLGSQWIGASEIFKILALAAFIQPVASTSEMVVISSGQGRLFLVLSVATAVVTCLSFVIGLPWGAKGVAMAYALANYLLFLPIFYYTFKNTAITLGHLAKAVYKPFFSSLLMGSVCVLVVPFMDDLNNLLRLPAGLFLSAAAYLVSFAVFPGGMDELRESWAYAELVFERNK